MTHTHTHTHHHQEALAWRGGGVDGWDRKAGVVQLQGRWQRAVGTHHELDQLGGCHAVHTRRTPRTLLVRTGRALLGHALAAFVMSAQDGRATWRRSRSLAPMRTARWHGPAKSRSMSPAKSRSMSENISDAQRQPSRN